MGISNLYDANSIVIKGTGVDDDDAFAEAVARMNALDDGTIWIDGTVVLNAQYNFTKPISIRGIRGREAKIATKLTAGTTLTWNSGFDALGQTEYAASTDQSFAQRVNSPSYTFTDGEWFLIRSDGAIEGCPSHGGINAIQSPMEIHQCADWDNTNKYAYVESFVVEEFPTAANSVVIPITMTQGVVVSDLEFTFAGSPYVGNDVNLLKFRKCNDVLVENVYIDREGPGTIYFQYCANVRVNDVVIEGVRRTTNGSVYGIMVGTSNGVIVSNSTINNTRHAFTTTSGDALTSNNQSGITVDHTTDTFTLSDHGYSDGEAVRINGTVVPTGLTEGTNYYIVNSTSSTFQLAETAGGSPIDFSSNGTSVSMYRNGRYGTPINVLVHDCLFNCTLDENSGQNTVLDTHAEGYGIIFQDCKVNLGGDPKKNVFLGGHGRARATKFIGCTFTGSLDYSDPANTGNPAGVALYADNCEVLNCTFSGVWQAVRLYHDTDRTYAPSNFTVDGNHFYRTKGEAIKVYKSTGNNHSITNNTFVDCGILSSNTPLILFEQLTGETHTGHVIRGNIMSKNNNDSSIVVNNWTTDMITIEGNVFTGYGDGNWGFVTSGAVRSADFDNTFGPFNLSDSGMVYPTFNEIYAVNASSAQTLSSDTPELLTAFDTAGEVLNMTTALGSDRLTVDYHGMYFVAFHVSFKYDVASTDLEFVVRTGTSPAETTIFARQQSSADTSEYVNVSASGIVALEDGEHIELWVESIGTAGNITVLHSALNAHRIGNYTP